jgi:hypothetical protein
MHCQVAHGDGIRNERVVKWFDGNANLIWFRWSLLVVHVTLVCFMMLALIFSQRNLVTLENCSRMSRTFEAKELGSEKVTDVGAANTEGVIAAG